MLGGSLGVGIGAIDGTISIAPTFTKSRSTILRNSEYLPYESERYAARLSVNSSIRNNLTVTYNTNVALSRYRSDSDSDYTSIITLSQKLNLSYAPIKKLQLKYSIEHYCNQLQTDNFKNYLFSDISASYLVGDKWEFGCSVKNLFDERYYSYFTESDLSSYYRSYTIRPRNILLEATYRF